MIELIVALSTKELHRLLRFRSKRVAEVRLSIMLEERNKNPDQEVLVQLGRKRRCIDAQRWKIQNEINRRRTHRDA